MTKQEIINELMQKLKFSSFSQQEIQDAKKRYEEMTLIQLQNILMINS